MTMERRTPTEEQPWVFCEGRLWECPKCGLNWCTWCNPSCDECKTRRPEPKG